ncbi:MAG: hypothetical protein AAGK14_11160 [Verrucomicrobiota bacterium]
MKPHPGKVIAYCWLLEGKPTDCVRWAIEALEAGYDSRNLRILAGLGESATSWDVREHGTKALAELGVAQPATSDEARLWYARSLILDLQEGIGKRAPILYRLHHICHHDPYRDVFDLNAFSIFYWADYDFHYGESRSFYCLEATPENFDEIIAKECQKWLAKHPGTNLPRSAA